MQISMQTWKLKDWALGNSWHLFLIAQTCRFGSTIDSLLSSLGRQTISFLQIYSDATRRKIFHPDLWEKGLPQTRWWMFGLQFVHLESGHNVLSSESGLFFMWMKVSYVSEVCWFRVWVSGHAGFFHVTTKRICLEAATAKFSHENKHVHTLANLY